LDKNKRNPKLATPKKNLKSVSIALALIVVVVIIAALTIYFVYNLPKTDDGTLPTPYTKCYSDPFTCSYTYSYSHSNIDSHANPYAHNFSYSSTNNLCVWKLKLLLNTPLLALLQGLE
jgi:flagellar basal body-associated protein FliL